MMQQEADAEGIKTPQEAVYTFSDGSTERVTLVKAHADGDGGGVTIFIPSLGRERQTVQERLQLLAGDGVATADASPLVASRVLYVAPEAAENGGKLTFEIVFSDGGLGFVLAERAPGPHAYAHEVVKGGQAGRGGVQEGDTLVYVNGWDVQGEGFHGCLELIKEAPRPLKIGFERAISAEENRTEDSSEEQDEECGSDDTEYGSDEEAEAVTAWCRAHLRYLYNRVGLTDKLAGVERLVTKFKGHEGHLLDTAAHKYTMHASYEAFLRDAQAPYREELQRIYLSPVRRPAQPAASPKRAGAESPDAAERLAHIDRLLDKFLGMECDLVEQARLKYGSVLYDQECTEEMSAARRPVAWGGLDDMLPPLPDCLRHYTCNAARKQDDEGS